MSATTALVRLPTVLRPQAGGNTTVEAEGGTVGQVLLALVNSYPGLGPSILDDEGGVRKFVNLYVNDEDVRFLENLETELVDGDEVAILPAVSGG